MRATIHLTRAPRLKAKAHLRAIHIVRDDKNSDMAYTSASTALYHVESDHAKQREPANDETEIANVRQDDCPD